MAMAMVMARCVMRMRGCRSLVEEYRSASDHGRSTPETLNLT
jgi:hypothetical protein